MKILVTAGGTIAPIDRVRSITNAFTGRTGARLALAAFERNHQVTLLTSHSDTAASVAGGTLPSDSRWELKSYRTIDDLLQLMRDQLQSGSCDAVIHSAAVSDYRSGGIYAPAPGVSFRPDGDGLNSPGPVRFIDRAAGKVKSDEPELWLRLVKAPKLIDLIRGEWKFAGLVVKFKLEVGVSGEELLRIAERSRIHSHADLMVANTLDQVGECAYLGPLDGRYERIARSELPSRLIDALERLQRERGDG
jgi:phosphopantothenate-cysteine ligase/phosphopantothenoylcysteine decarboxylase/phosphopantothenate--cysteine ligase